MRNIWKYAVLTAVISLSVLLAGCGSSKATEMEQTSYDTGSGDIMMPAGEADTAAQEAAPLENETQGQEAAPEDDGTVAESGRKLIRTVYLSVETEAFDELITRLETKVTGLGGYIESIDAYMGSVTLEYEKNANLTIRIPIEKMEEFITEVTDYSNVIRREENAQDVTLQYVDTQSRKNALQAEQERLLTLMEQAESVEDIITIEARLSEVRYQLESIESQLRTLDNQVDYATIQIAVSEVTRLSATSNLSVWEKMSQGFMNSVYGLGEDSINFLIGLVVFFPYLALWGVVIFLIVFVARKIYKKRKFKNEEVIRRRHQAAVNNTQDKQEKQENPTDGE